MIFSWKSVANDEDVSDAVDENAAQRWMHRCGHIVGMRQQRLGQVFSLSYPIIFVWYSKIVSIYLRQKLHPGRILDHWNHPSVKQQVLHLINMTVWYPRKTYIITHFHYCMYANNRQKFKLDMCNNNNNDNVSNTRSNNAQMVTCNLNTSRTMTEKWSCSSQTSTPWN